MIALACAFTAMAQSAEEIISRMEAEMEKHEKDGLIMVIDVKVPVLGTMTTKTYSLGNYYRIDATVMGVDAYTYSDGKTQWTYIPKKNLIEIEDENPDNPTDEGDAEMFSGITDGYDVSIEKETADAWYILCKKSKTNTDKDDPKTINLVVAKATYYPVSLKAKVSGMTITLRDVSFGVSEEMVTFDINDYPDATIKDKRSGA